MLSTKSGAFSRRRFLAAAGSAGHAAAALVSCGSGDDDGQAAPASTAQPAARRQQQQQAAPAQQQARQQVQQQAAEQDQAAAQQQAAQEQASAQAAPPRTLRIAALGGGGPLGTYATPERIEAVREQLDLDDPALICCARWLGGALQGDLGRSVRVDQPDADLIARPALNTAVLSAVAFAAISAVALILAALGGVHEWPRTAAVAFGAALIGGTVVVERVFALPVLGSMLVDRIRSHDAPVIEAIALFQAAARIAAFAIADLIGFFAAPARRTAPE